LGLAEVARDVRARNVRAPTAIRTVLIENLLFGGGVYTKAGENLSPDKLWYTPRLRETYKKANRLGLNRFNIGAIDLLWCVRIV
jgi:hypothetical protein